MLAISAHALHCRRPRLSSDLKGGVVSPGNGEASWRHGIGVGGHYPPLSHCARTMAEHGLTSSVINFTWVVMSPFSDRVCCLCICARERTDVHVCVGTRVHSCMSMCVCVCTLYMRACLMLCVLPWVWPCR